MCGMLIDAHLLNKQNEKSVANLIQILHSVWKHGVTPKNKFILKSQLLYRWITKKIAGNKKIFGRWPQKEMKYEKMKRNM